MITRSLLLALPLLFGSCGGGGADAAGQTDAGYAAIGTQDWSTAQTEFEAALATMGEDPSNAQYMRAKMGHLNALAHLDPQEAIDEFTATAEAQKLGDREYSMVCGYLMDAGKIAEATSLADQGLKSFPESKLLAGLMEKLVAASQSNPELAEQLKGLGYL